MIAFIIRIIPLLSLTCSSALAANWTITDLGALGAEGSLVYTSVACSINNSGQIAGQGVALVNSVREMHFVVWSNGTQTDLGIRGEVTLAPINDAGDIAVCDQIFFRRSYVLTGGGIITVNVPGLHPSFGTTGVADINNAGQVCGDFNPDATIVSVGHAFLWQAGVGTPLPEYPGGDSHAVALNNLGHVIGRARNPAAGQVAALWRDGTLTSLSDLPEVVAAGWSGLDVRGINDHDQIVGRGWIGGQLHALLLSPVVVPPLTITRGGPDVVLSFPSQTGVSYQLQSSTTLLPGGWLDLGVPLAGTGATLSVNVTIGPEPKKFFRLRIVN